MAEERSGEKGGFVWRHGALVVEQGSGVGIGHYTRKIAGTRDELIYGGFLYQDHLLLLVLILCVVLIVYLL